ncbi:hypothetical protein GN956_G9782 [Arapaima gigas]
MKENLIQGGKEEEKGRSARKGGEGGEREKGDGEQRERCVPSSFTARDTRMPAGSGDTIIGIQQQEREAMDEDGRRVSPPVLRGPRMSHGVSLTLLKTGSNESPEVRHVSLKL